MRRQKKSIAKKLVRKKKLTQPTSEAQRNMKNSNVAKPQNLPLLKKKVVSSKLLVPECSTIFQKKRSRCKKISSKKRRIKKLEKLD